jgi:hypothetical protein
MSGSWGRGLGYFLFSIVGAIESWGGGVSERGRTDEKKEKKEYMLKKLF